MSKIDFHSNVDEILKMKDDAVERALEAIGQQAEAYAKLKAPADTGLLRNSITHAVGGSSTSISNYHADNPDKNGEIKSGSYGGGSVGKEGDETVYLATNVSYAPYQENGTRRTKAHPFFKPAVQDHVAEYKQIAEKYLQDI